MSNIFQDWKVHRDLLHYHTLSTVSNGQVHIEIGGDITPEEQAQIAYLVKAAPQMLTALKEALPLLWEMSFAGSFSVNRIHDRCKAAIAETEGSLPQ
jgi:hypothetical protein